VSDRLTDEELADIVRGLRYKDGAEKFPEDWGLGGVTDASAVTVIERLVAEVRRLRALVKRAHADLIAKDPEEAAPVDYEQGLCLFCGEAVGRNQGKPHAPDCVWLAVEREARR
jgi:hypothetical protein